MRQLINYIQSLITQTLLIMVKIVLYTLAYIKWPTIYTCGNGVAIFLSFSNKHNLQTSGLQEISAHVSTTLSMCVQYLVT